MPTCTNWCGYQSDTVTTGIALTSSATTRRGLYVAATRGRNRNELCVITDSDDLAEARDVVEAVLALDRADVPAVTQRRTLAQAVPRLAAIPRTPARPSGPATQPRCPMPAWFNQLLDDTSRQAVAIERANDERRSAGRRLIERSNDGQRVLRRVSAETAMARAQHADASRRLESAEVSRRIAGRLLKESGWRGRRHSRQHLADCDVAVDIARSILEQVEMATAPDRQRHRDAHAAAKQAHDDLHHRQRSRMLRRDKSSEPLVQRAAALQTWRHWADGEPVAAAQLADAVAQLRTAVPGDPTGHLRQLCDLVRLISPEITAVHPNMAHPLRPSGPTLSL